MDCSHYDSGAMIRGQTWDWDCSAAATAWMGRSLGWVWIETDVAYEFVKAGIATPQLGLLDHTGVGIVRWLSLQPFDASSSAITFDDLVDLSLKGPVIMGSSKWYHWTGVRSVNTNGVIQLANSAPGWAGIFGTMRRDQFDSFGDFFGVYPECAES